MEMSLSQEYDSDDSANSLMTTKREAEAAAGYVKKCKFSDGTFAGQSESTKLVDRQIGSFSDSESGTGSVLNRDNSAGTFSIGDPECPTPNLQNHNRVARQQQPQNLGIQIGDDEKTNPQSDADDTNSECSTEVQSGKRSFKPESTCCLRCVYFI